MTLGEIAKEYYVVRKFNCGVSLVLAASDIYGLGIQIKDAKLLTAFGGGMGCGNFCGALAGAEAVLGRLLLPEGVMYSPEFKEQCAQFLSLFEQEFGGTLCAPIRDRNATPEERCGLTVLLTGNLLQEFLKSQCVN